MGASKSPLSRRPLAGAARVTGILAAAVMVAGLFVAMPAPVRGDTGGATFLRILEWDNGSCVAGAPCMIQVQAQPWTDYFSDGVHFTSDDPQATLPPDYVFKWGREPDGGDGGYHDFAIILKTAGLVTLTVTDITVPSLTGSLTIMCWPGPAARIVESVPAATTAGAASQVSVRVEDAWHNLVTDYAGTVHFTSTDSGATLPADYTFSHADRGTAWWPVTFANAGSQSVTVRDIAQPSLTDTQGTTVTAAPHLVVDLFAHISAGASGMCYPVTAVNAAGTTATGYLGTIHFTSSDAHADLPSDYTFQGPDSGAACVYGVTLKTVGSQYVRAVDTGNSYIQGSSTTVVTPGPSTTVVVAGLASAVAAGVQTSVSVTLKDSYGNVNTNYLGGNVTLTSSDPLAVLPPVYQYIAGDGGTHTFNVDFNTAGAQTLHVAAGSLTGSASTSVLAGHTPPTTYHALQPRRVLDSRPTASNHTNIGLTGKFTAGTVRTFTVGGALYVGGGTNPAIPSNSVAVTGNLTIVGETASGLIALGPTMTATGDVTTINFVKGDTRANNVTLGLSAGGTLSAVFRSTAGATTDVIFDVTGYFLADTSGATYHAVTPGRVLDSRPTNSAHTNIGLTGKFANQKVRTFSVSGVTAIGWTSALVPSIATAVTGNVTVTNATSVGFVSIGPMMVSLPTTSTVNVAKGVNCANGVTVALGTATLAGKLQAVWVGTSGSSADVIFDVTGFFTNDATGLSYHPIAPIRLLDSSSARGLAGVFTSSTPRGLTVGGLGGILSDAAGISGNLTLINPSSNGFAFISPLSVAVPTSSTVNGTTGRNVANGFDVPLDTGGVVLIWVGATGSTAHLQLDVTGYWK